VITDEANVTVATPAVTSVDTGVYYAEVPWTITYANDILVLRWTYTLGGAGGTRVDTIEIVEPYLSVEDLYEVAPAGTSYDEIKMAEMYARYSIEAYCSQKFYPYASVAFAIGNDRDVLPLTKRIVAVDSISVNGEVVYDDTTNDFGHPVEISDTNKAARLMVDPDDSIPGWNESTTFEGGVRYDVKGTFGWAAPPPAITAVAKLLANDFFCKESVWKNRFVTSISASDWRVVFNSEASRGTGNATADRILDPYCAINWIVI
jgi:hypothetical protein